MPTRINLAGQLHELDSTIGTAAENGFIIVADTAARSALDENFLNVGQLCCVLSPSGGDPANQVYQLVSKGPAQWSQFARGPRILSGSREVVYVNTDTGDDSTGDGSSGNPYATPMRAALDAPQFCINGGSWVCRIEGSTTITRTETWVLPVMIGDNTYSHPATPVDPAFPVERNYNFIAVMPRATGNDPITDAQSDITPLDPGRTLISLHNTGDVNPLYPIGGSLAGYTFRSGDGTLAAVIANDATNISTPWEPSEITYPIEVMNYGCKIRVVGNDAVAHMGANNNSIQFCGIWFTNDNTATYPHQGVIAMEGSAFISFVACHVKGINTSAVHHIYLYACLTGGSGEDTNVTIDGLQIDFYRCTEINTAFDQFLMNDYRHIWCYMAGCDRVGHTQGAGSNGTFTLVSCKITNPPGQSAIAYYGGPQCFLYTLNIGGNGYGVQALLPGQIAVTNCNFTEIAAEVSIQAANGGQVILNSPTGINSVSSDYQGQIDPTTGLMATVNGTPGSTVRGFRLVAVSTNGSRTRDDGGPDLISGVLVNNGPATITSVNNISLTWTDPVSGDFDHVQVWEVDDQGTVHFLLGTVASGVQAFLYDDTVTPVGGFYPPYNVIKYADWVAMGKDTDKAPYSGGPVRSRVWQAAIP